jgi:chorismate dehydratase
MKPDAARSSRSRQFSVLPSRNHGLLHIEQLVEEWTPRIAIPPSTIRHYLASNIHYVLNTDCVRAIELFRQFAAEVDVLPPLPNLRFL